MEIIGVNLGQIMYKQNENLNIKSWAEEDRPREKLVIKGIAALSDAELIAIIIGSGTPTMSAVELSKLILLEANNDLHRLAKMTLVDLQKFKGIGAAKAISVVAAMELGRRRKETVVEHQPIVKCASQLYDVIKPHLMDLPHEEMWLLSLNRANKVTKFDKIGVGGLSGVYVDMKIIFKKALENMAASIAIVHNHPSGNLKPSDADIKITKKVIASCQLLDIDFIDHLIFTDNGYYSFIDSADL